MNHDIKTFWASMLLILSACTFLAGCNTIEGAGQDIESAGEAIEDSAQ